MNRLRQHGKLQEKCNHIRPKRKNLFGSTVYCSRFAFWQVNILEKIIVSLSLVISKLFLNKSILGNGQLVDGSTVLYTTIGQLCLQLVEITKPLLKFMVDIKINFTFYIIYFKYLISYITKSLDYTVALVSSGSSTFEKSWEQSKFYFALP